MKKKVILLTEIISPYRIPVFNELAKSKENQFLVLFFGKTEKRRKWKVYREKIKFHYEILPGIRFQKKSLAPYFFNPTIFFRLLKYSPEVVIIGGYHHPSSLLAILYAKSFKRRIILWCESNKYDYRSYSSWKEAYKRWFIRNCTAYIVPGKASFEYLMSLGAEAKKVWIAPNAVDNNYFSQASEKYRENRELFKEAKGYPEKVILYVGRLIDQKGVPDLLKAFQILSRQRADLGLLLIGNGEGEKGYRDFCKTNGIKNVFLEGFVQQEDIPPYYAAADVFVLPTHSDPWGLVLNEAMACQLPVISSDVAGAAHDLIIDGENGHIFKAGDIGQLVSRLKDILTDGQKRARMGQRSRSIINGYSPFKCAEGIMRAARGEF